MAGIVALLLLLSLVGGAPAQEDAEVRHYTNFHVLVDKDGMHMKSRHRVVKQRDNVIVEFDLPLPLE